jgi:nicotinamide mononucleotide transporter
VQWNQPLQSFEVTNSSGPNLLIGIGASIIYGVVSGYLHHKISNVSLPYLDATLTGFSIWGTYLAAKKKIENWLVWIFADILYIGVYMYKGMNGTAVLYAVFLLFAFRGFYAWRKKLL